MVFRRAVYLHQVVGPPEADGWRVERDFPEALPSLTLYPLNQPQAQRPKSLCLGS